MIILLMKLSASSSPTCDLCGWKVSRTDGGPQVDEEPFSPTVSSRAFEEDVGLGVDEEAVSEDVSHQEEEAVIDLIVKTPKRKH